MFSNIAATSPHRFSLKQRVLSAGVWSLAGHATTQTIRFGSNLLMTRLLIPEMFGVMAIATTVMVAMGMFSDFGLKQNVIQSKRGSHPVFLNTAWVTQVLRGGVLWVVGVSVAVLLLLADRANLIPPGTAYADPSLPYAIAVLSLSALISGFQSTKLFEAARDLSIRRITQIEISSQIAGLLCMIGWVLVDRSIWALVVGSLCSTLTTTIISHRLPGVANRWEWDRSDFREIIHFGQWIFIASVLGFLVINGDRLVLGGLIDATAFGVFVIAYLLINSVDQVLAKIIAEISFPALSEIARVRPIDVKKSLYHFQLGIGSFAYFCAGILMVSGQGLIGLLYDRRYEQAGWMVEVLAVTLLAVPARTAMQGFMAIGMPHLLSNILLVRLSTLVAFIPIGFHFFGVTGALWGSVFSHLSVMPPTVFYSIRHKLFDIRKEVFLVPMIVVGMVVGKLFVISIGFASP
jgi:O-antigen/teichoic acid export membrane protein